MQSQVDRVIAYRIPAANLIIQPEREIGERPGLEKSPDLRPTVPRRESRIGEDGVIVEMKRANKRPTESRNGGSDQHELRTGDDATSVANTATPPKLIPKPKSAAERKARVMKILAILDKTYPAATCALHHRNAWELMVATILSAQCTDKRVNEVTPGLFKKYPSMEDFAHASQAEMAQDVRSTGFFNNKSKSVIGAAKKILSDYGGKVPRNIDDLLTVPGAARKTANVVLGTAFGIAAGIVVDTHVTRVSRRLDMTRESEPGKIEKDLMKAIPENKWILFSHQIIHHGRALCVARKPLCAKCPLDKLCYAKDKTV